MQITLQGKSPPMNEKLLNIRIPPSEFELLTRYAAQTNRTKSDVVREFLRSLEKRLEPEPVKAKKKR